MKELFVTDMVNNPTPADTRTSSSDTAFVVILGLSLGHLINDTMQSLIPALYPMLKVSFGLDFTRIGVLGFVFQVTASLLQPVVGIMTDKRPQPYSLAVGMGFTLVGLLFLAFAQVYWFLLVGASF